MSATLVMALAFAGASGLYPMDNLCADVLLPPELCDTETDCHCITPIHECGFWVFPNLIYNRIEGDDNKVFFQEVVCHVEFRCQPLDPTAPGCDYDWQCVKIPSLEYITDIAYVWEFTFGNELQPC